MADRAKPARWLAGGKVIDEGFEIAGERRFLCSPDPGRRLRLLQSACRFDSFGCHINTDGDCWTLRVALMARRRQAIPVRIAAGHSVRLRLSASLQTGPADGLRLPIDFHVSSPLSAPRLRACWPSLGVPLHRHGESAGPSSPASITASSGADVNILGAKSRAGCQHTDSASNVKP